MEANEIGAFEDEQALELTDYLKQKISKSYKFMDANMTDSDCSEDYDNDPFF